MDNSALSLENSLVETRKNISNYKILQRIFNRNNFIPFIGAGISMPTGEPRWGKMFELLNAGLKLSIDEVKNPDGTPNYPESFSSIFKQVKNKQDFFNEVFKCVEQTETTYTAAHIEIIRVFKSIITTNYDNSFEEAFSSIKYPDKIKRYFFSPFDDSQEFNGIVYLHGHTDIKFVILKKEDYEYFYPKASQKDGIPVIEDFLEFLYKERSIVFIGCSFDDKYIATTLKYLASSNKDKNHFILIKSDNAMYKKYEKKIMDSNYRGKHGEIEESFYASFEGMGIKPIIYKEHAFVDKLFKSLGESTKDISVSEPQITGDPN